MDVFAVIEHCDGEPAPIGLELLNLANSIKGSDKSNAIVLGKNTKMLAEPLAKYADKVWAVEDEVLEHYNPELYTDIISQILRVNKSAIILFGDTPFGKETAPCVAVKLNAPVQTDVMSVDVSDGVSVSKYLFQGKAMIDLALRKAEFYVMTVRQRVFKEGPQVSGEIEVLDLKPSIEPRRTFKEYIEPEAGEIDIMTQDVVVTAGKGIGDLSKTTIADDLAELLGGVTAGSRPIIDNGWLPKDRQVGLSGKIINPKLYFGLGVSGASQHVLGMKDSDLIIAINKDPEAPIFGVAEYCVTGDVHEIVPELINQLRQIKEQS